MSVISQLASKLASRDKQANARVANRCIARPELIFEIVASLVEDDAKLAGDCAEVLTKIAESDPALVSPHAKNLLASLAHDSARVRWEAAHALALVAHLVRRLMATNLAGLARLARNDDSVIVRDYVLDAIAAHAAGGPTAAAKSLGILRDSAGRWDGKHAARILTALERVALDVPKMRGDVRTLATSFENHARPGARKAAKTLLRKLDAC